MSRDGSGLRRVVVPRAARTGSATAGFTLIEILVVVAIIAIITAAALLSADLADGERAVETEARRMLELTRLACERAATTGRDYGIEVGTDRYAFSRAQGPAWRIESDGELRERLLPEGLRLSVEREGHAVETDPERVHAQPAVVCAASGELTPFHARIANAGGIAYEVRGEIDGALTLARTGGRE